MGKLIVKPSKEPNAVSVRGGDFPLPLQMVGPNTWHNIISADYGVSPFDRTSLAKPTFGQVAELAGVALTDRYQHREDKAHNPLLNPVISSINDGNKVLTGDTLWIIVPDKKLYVVNYPNAELSAQFGVNDQEVLEKLVAGFNAQLIGRKERYGITNAGNISLVSVSNVSQGNQSRNPKADNYLGNNLGLRASVGSKEVARSLTIGSNSYANGPYFGLNAESGKIVTRVPVLYAGGFGGLGVCGGRSAGCGSGCSFGYSKSGEATAPKK